MKIKAILIDAKNREVKKIEIENSLQEYYKVLDCDTITAAYFRDANITDVAYIDDNGLISNPEHFFYHPDFYQPFAGNGLIVGSDMETGDTISAQTLDTFDASKVEFFDVAEMQLATMLGRFNNC